MAPAAARRPPLPLPHFAYILILFFAPPFGILFVLLCIRFRADGVAATALGSARRAIAERESVTIKLLQCTAARGKKRQDKYSAFIHLQF